MKLSQTWLNSVSERFNSEAEKKSLPRSPWVACLRVAVVTAVSAFLLKMFVVEAFRIPSASMERTLLVGDYVLVSKLAYGLRTPRRLPLTATAASALKVALLGAVNRGDVIVFDYPGAPNGGMTKARIPFVKRCVGLPGDTIQIREGCVVVNGTAVRFPPGAGQESNTNDAWWGPVVVPRAGMRIDLDAETVEDWRRVLEQEGHTAAIAGDGSVLLDGRPAQSYTIGQDYYFVLGDNRGNSLDSRHWGFVPGDHVIGRAVLVYWSWDPRVPAGSLPDAFGRVRWNRVGTLIR